MLRWVLLVVSLLAFAGATQVNTPGLLALLLFVGLVTFVSAALIFIADRVGSVQQGQGHREVGMLMTAQQLARQGGPPVMQRTPVSAAAAVRTTPAVAAQPHDVSAAPTPIPAADPPMPAPAPAPATLPPGIPRAEPGVVPNFGPRPAAAKTAAAAPRTAPAAAPRATPAAAPRPVPAPAPGVTPGAAAKSAPRATATPAATAPTAARPGSAPVARPPVDPSRVS